MQMDAKWIYVPLIYENLNQRFQLSKSQNAPSIMF